MTTRRTVVLLIESCELAKDAKVYTFGSWDAAERWIRKHHKLTMDDYTKYVQKYDDAHESRQATHSYTVFLDEPDSTDPDVEAVYEAMELPVTP
jgi:hypothetical protein